MDLPGFIDLGPEALQRIEALKSKAMAVFARYGYARIAPPIVESADTVLELSGEDIRRRMYFFDDPDGRELCLRPDLTIPACRMLIRGGWSGERVARLSYAGPVFRHESEIGHGRSHQFTQAGVECLGPLDPVFADAEVVALALDTVSACGIANPTLRLGDAGLVHSVLSQLPLSRASRLKLERDAVSGSRAGRKAAPALARSLEKLPRDEATAFVAEMMQVAGIKPVGDRSLGEIVERLIESTSAESDDGEGAYAAAESFLAIRGAPSRALGEIESFLKTWKLKGRERLDALSRSLQLMERLGADLGRATFAAGLKRHIDYYTGLVFEVAAERGKIRDIVCGGGRYDRLVSVLSPTLSAPAAGFAMSLEMIAVVLDKDFASGGAIDETVDADVIGDSENAAAAAAALRRGGWRVRVVPRGDATSAPYVVEMKSAKEASVREATKKAPQNVALAQLQAFAEARPCT